MITPDAVTKLDELLARGLKSGNGTAGGRMCIEEAICLAMGEPFSDRPTCVDSAVREYSMRLNDSKWSSAEARAAGMRDLAIAQLGSNGVVSAPAFMVRLAELTIRELLPALFRSLPNATPAMLAAADRGEAEGTATAAIAAAIAAAQYAAAYAANSAQYTAAANSAYAAAATDAAAAAAASVARSYVAYGGDRFLLLSASLAVRVLRELKSPGAELLP